MQKILFSFGLFVLVILTLNNNDSYAVVAYPNPVEYKLPDGTKITIVMKGDEKVSWAETVDGYSILLNKEGYYEYAVKNGKGNMERSGVRVNSPSSRSITEKKFLETLTKGITYSKNQVSIMKQIWEINRKESAKAFPTTGDRKLICILVNFNDLAFSLTQGDFDELFNQVGYNVDGATGSVKDYYLENSYGQFNLTVDVAGPYTVSEDMAFYGGEGGTDNPRPMVSEAVGLADADVNYSEYDNDSDGEVDGVYIIFAGYGKEAGGPAGSIWSHAWSLWPAVNYDGVAISRYSCSPELRGNSGTNISRIGVICHEFGHVLGAPDYYDTDYEDGGSFSGTGQWDMMAGGSWNNGGATPAHHNGFTKVVYYNWAEATVLSSPTTVTLENAAENSNSFYIVNTQTADEYYLLENREKHLFDAYIPGSGLMIYHVHSGVFSVGNSINATHPQRMYPVSQNATVDPTSTASSYGNINDASCAWTGIGKTEFSDGSLPSSKSWAGENTDKPITNIDRDASGKTVTFSFMDGILDNPANFEAQALSVSSIDLSWNLNNDSNPVVVAWSIDGQFGTPVDGATYSAGNSIGGGTVLYSGSDLSYAHTGLNANTTYYYKAWSLLDDGSYSSGVVASESTLCGAIYSLPFTENFNDSETCPDCWTVEDNEGNGQVWEFGAHAEGLSGTTGNYAYLNSDEYGSGSSQNTDLISPTFDLSSYADVNLSFTHYFRFYTGSSATLYYSIDGGDIWNQVASWSSDINNPSYFSENIPEVEGQSNVKFKWNYTGSWGYYWDVDDIELSGVVSNPKTLTINKSGSGNVFVNGNAYTNSISFSQGTVVEIQADPDAGWVFNGWSGDLVSSNTSETITLDTDMEVTATFTQLPEYTLSISVEGNGTVEVDGAPYQSPITTAQGTMFSLMAIPDDGWEFYGWSNSLTSSQQNESIELNSNKSVKATFTSVSNVELNKLADIKIFPNPFTSEINIKNAESVSSIVITNLVGQQLKQVNFSANESFTIQTNELGQGVYFIILKSVNGEKEVRKLVKQ